MISAALGPYGLESIAGSSSRRGREVALLLLRVMRAGTVAVVAPDGPRRQGASYPKVLSDLRLLAIADCALRHLGTAKPTPRQMGPDGAPAFPSTLRRLRAADPTRGTGSDRDSRVVITSYQREH
ncbi:DUF374 domain-containing protein [Muricoccus radiodurans]|uniref:DUF374 domain-containing protein n=1 Tax=Muricoccus radiodurans TaxID=2231721 RepID=UPI003CF9CA32